MKAPLRALGASLALALAGCSGLRSQAPETVSYLLRAPAPAAAAASAPAGPLAGQSLKVVRVVAQPGYDGDRILLLGADRSLGFYSGSRWVEPLPAVVGTLAVEALRNAATLRYVLDDTAPFGADYTLRLTIRRFDAEYPSAGAPPRVTVGFACTVARADRSVLENFVVQAEVPAAADRMAAVVEAFEQATQQALGESVRRTLGVLQANVGASAAAPPTAVAGSTAAAAAAAPAPAPAAASATR